MTEDLMRIRSGIEILANLVYDAGGKGISVTTERPWLDRDEVAPVRELLKWLDATIAPDEFDIGCDVVVRIDDDGCGFTWRHLGCRDRNWHHIEEPSTEWLQLTFDREFMCHAEGCDKRGRIELGRWVSQ